MNRHGSPLVFLKSTGTPSWYRVFKFRPSKSPVGIEVRSLKHHWIPPLNRCSVQRELRFCRKRTQNVDLPDPVRSAMIHVNGCLNLTSVLIALVEMTLSPRNRLIYPRRVQTNYRLSDGAWNMILCRFFHVFCRYRYTSTVDSLSFNLFISVNRDGAVWTPV